MELKEQKSLYINIILDCQEPSFKQLESEASVALNSSEEKWSVMAGGYVRRIAQAMKHSMCWSAWTGRER